MSVAPTRPRVPFWLRLVTVVALLMPIIEIVVIVLVWHVIGWWTLLALAACFVAGVVVIQRASREAVAELRMAMQTGRPPAQQVADAPQLVVGGILLLIPGLVTSLIGLIAILPGARSLSRHLTQALIARRVVRAAGTSYGAAGTPYGTVPGPGPRQHSRPDVLEGDIIEGEIVEDDEK